MKIISGGQTGVDRAALDAADALGIEWGGWAPWNWKAEDGHVPVKYRANMREATSRGYEARTVYNVEEADATLILYRGRLSGGTRLTRDLAAARNRDAFLAVNLDDVGPDPVGSQVVKGISAWMRRYGTVNVAGPRESKCPGIYDQAKTLLLEALR